VQHQQQVAVAVERAKQITMAELNAVMQVAHQSPPMLIVLQGWGWIWIRISFRCWILIRIPSLDPDPGQDPVFQLAKLAQRL
jgi:hypothetical protein